MWLEGSTSTCGGAYKQFQRICVMEANNFDFSVSTWTFASEWVYGSAARQNRDWI